MKAGVSVRAACALDVTAAVTAGVSSAGSADAAARAEVDDRAVSQALLTLLVGEERELAGTMELIESTWQPSYLPMALEFMLLAMALKAKKRTNLLSA